MAEGNRKRKKELKDIYNNETRKKDWEKPIQKTSLPQLWVKIGRRQPQLSHNFESKSAEDDRKSEKGLKDIYNNETRKKDWEKPILTQRGVIL